MPPYHRPTTLDEALALLASGERRPLAGGTVLNAGRGPKPYEVVDLQALGLDAVEASNGSLALGAMVRLQDLMEHPQVPELLRELAQAELPSAMRTLATVGGTIAAGGGESVLLAGLLAYGADARRDGELITSVDIAVTGRGAWSRTGRTPSDTPIVAAVGRVDEAGTLQLALTGMGSQPVLVDPADPTAGLAPPDDFRGSASYRLELAAVLSRRVTEELS